MATYGKKKRSLLSGFSVFRDDQPASDAKLGSTSGQSVLHFGSNLLIYHPVSTSSRLGRAKSALQNSKTRQMIDDDSLDDLAGDEVGNLAGAIGQLFIFLTLSLYGSLTLVTITVTRKMMTMLLSVFLFGHNLSLGQWAAVVLVFAAICVEAEFKRREGASRKRSKAG